MGENITRRTVLRGAGAAGAVAAAAASAAACGSSTSGTTTTTSAPAATTSAGTTTSSGSGTSSATAGGAASGTSVAKADVPVGGGKIVGAAVVTQPTSGTFNAFSSTCTHQGCTVADVSNNSINCRCHGSSFDASTGAVTAGPARSALPAKTVTDSGSSVVVS